MVLGLYKQSFEFFTPIEITHLPIKKIIKI